MSLKSKISSALAAGFAVAAVAAAASAQSTAPTTSESKPDDKMAERGEHRGGYGKQKGGPGGFMRELRDVNLTDSQKAQLRTIFEANKPDPATTQEMRSLMEAKRGGTLTAEQQARFKALRQDRRAKGESMRAQVMAILTPEQQAQVEQKRQEMMQSRQERREDRRNEGKTDSDKPSDNQ